MSISLPEIAPTDLELDPHPLGSGIGGVVRKGLWRGAVVAVKTVHCLPTDENMRQSFAQECSILARVANHPNVVKFIGCCTRLPHLLLVSQFCEHGSLFDFLIVRNAQVSHVDLVRMMKETAAGLIHLHAENIIHRDLAARNVLVDSRLNCFVTDFGMARVKEASRSYGRTQSNYGPVKWMAPECFKKEYSFATDVWSYGVFLFEITQRKEPYPEGMNLLDIALEIKQQQLKPEVPDNVPPEIQNIMRSCWDFNPALRPSMSTLFSRLQSYHMALIQV